MSDYEIVGGGKSASEWRGAVTNDLTHIKRMLEEQGRKLEQFVPRTELDSKFHDHDRRIKGVEGNITWLARSAFGSWLAGIGVAIGLVKSVH